MPCHEKPRIDVEERLGDNIAYFAVVSKIFSTVAMLSRELNHWCASEYTMLMICSSLFFRNLFGDRASDSK